MDPEAFLAQVRAFAATDYERAAFDLVVARFSNAQLAQQNQAMAAELEALREGTEP